MRMKIANTAGLDQGQLITGVRQEERAAWGSYDVGHRHEHLRQGLVTVQTTARDDGQAFAHRAPARFGSARAQRQPDGSGQRGQDDEPGEDE